MLIWKVKLSGGWGELRGILTVLLDALGYLHLCLLLLVGVPYILAEARR